MSVGRHARKRAAQQAEQTAATENRLLNEQEALLKKEEAKKAAMEKDTEGQRIATMRARFGGQVPQQTSNPNSTGGANIQGVAQGGTTRGSKNKTPAPITGKSPIDPMRQTIMSMMQGNDDGVM